MFQDADLQTVILTSKLGLQLLNAADKKSPNTTIEVIGDNPTFGEAEFKAAYDLLYTKYNVRHLDVTAGGVVIGALMYYKYLAANGS